MYSGRASARASESLGAASAQSSQLLPELFRDINPEQRLSVLHLGPAFSDTVAFFSTFRCRLQVVDLFSELPLPEPDDELDRMTQLQRHFADVLQLPGDHRFDICLFWDLFDYLGDAALTALLHVLRPHLKPASLAHGFSMHSPRSPAQPYLYGIRENGALSIRSRTQTPPGYAPHNPKRLRDLLHCFRLERSVLLPDRRLEMLLRAQLPSAA